jgi:hypothetical protein
MIILAQRWTNKAGSESLPAYHLEMLCLRREGNAHYGLYSQFYTQEQVQAQAWDKPAKVWSRGTSSYLPVISAASARVLMCDWPDDQTQMAAGYIEQITGIYNNMNDLLKGAAEWAKTLPSAR